MSKLDNFRCAVLDISYQPRSIGTARRGLNLFLQDKAVIIEEYPDEMIHSGREIYPIPKTVVMKYAVKGRPVFNVPAQLTQSNLFTRDGYICQYCGRHKSELKATETLTREHIHPQDKGGPDVWLNVTTACSTCNNKKANYFLKDLEALGIPMRLRSQPKVPTIFELWAKKSFGKRKRHV